MDEYIKREEIRRAYEKLARSYMHGEPYIADWKFDEMIEELPAFDVIPVRHGRWIMEAHYERENYRWNVTAECSECCDERKEIWAGFFPGVPPYIARDVALADAESVKLSNYCPNCGARMDGGDIDAKAD